MSDLQVSPAEAPADNHGPAPAGADPGGHHSSGGSHRGGHKKHGDHGAHGGHGGSWIITYCDMITLLIAFFICILTFASKESGKGSHHKLHDSVLYGPGGTGIAGPSGKPGDQDAVTWRQVLVSTNVEAEGSSMPPLYSDPAWNETNKALAMLEKTGDSTLSESYGLTVPAAMLFADHNALTSSGKQLLQTIANNLRPLPYELFIRVDNPSQLSRATTISQFFVGQGGIPPNRLGIGMNGAGKGPSDSVQFLLVKRPRQSGR